MNNYLRHLAATLTRSPHAMVRPRLPGQFEVQSLAAFTAEDAIAADNAALTGTSDFPNAAVAPSAHSHQPITRRDILPGDTVGQPHHAPAPQAPSQSTSQRSMAMKSPTGESLVSANGGQQPISTPGAAAIPATASPAPQSAKKLPAAETETQSIHARKTEPATLSPASTSSPDSIAGDRHAPPAHRWPIPPTPATIHSAPAQSTTAGPPTGTPPTPDLLPKIRPATPALNRSAQGTAAPGTVTTHPRHVNGQSEQRPQLVASKPTTAQLAQSPSAASTPDRIDGRHTIEPHRVRQSADRPAHNAVAGQPMSVQSLPTSVPTIRVTIGRIDVKASTAPPPQPAVRSTLRKPAMTLEQHLHARRGGGG